MRLRLPAAAVAAVASVTLAAAPADAAPIWGPAAPAPDSAAAASGLASALAAVPSLVGPGAIVAAAASAAVPKPGTPGKPPPPANLGAAGRPMSVLTLTVADNGRRVRAHRGEHILVRLSVDPLQHPDPTTWWQPVDESGTALRVRPQTVMPVRGTTLGHFRAVARGEATLASIRPVCPAQPNGPTCHAVQGWHVTVDVR